MRFLQCQMSALALPICVVALVLVCSSVQATNFEFGDLYFESIGTQGEGPGHNVSAVVQDREGFIWVGTPSGLFRYDGYRFRRANVSLPSGSLSNALVRSLLVDRSGRLWVGTGAEGLFVFDPGTATLLHFRHDAADPASLSHDTVRALAEDAAGDIWIGTDGGLDHLPHGESRIVRAHPGPTSSAAGDPRVQALLADRSGDLWIGTWNGLSRRRHDSTVIERLHSSVVGKDAFAGELVAPLHELDDGRIVVGTVRKGAFLLSADGVELTRVTLPGREQLGRGDPAVVAAIQPNQDELWLAGYGGIIVMSVDGSRLIRHLKRDVAVTSSLAHSQVSVLMQDDTGHIWIGGFGGGLQRHDPNNRAIRILRHSPSNPAALTSPDISSVLELDNHEIWVGSRDNGIDIIDRERGLIGAIRPGGSEPGALKNGMIFSLAQTQDRSVWVGTFGLHRFSPETHVPLPLEESPPLLQNAAIRKLFVARNGHLWIGTNVGLAHWLPNTRSIAMVSAVDGAPVTGDVNAIVEASDGRLWVGGRFGATSLYTIEPGAKQLQPMNLYSKTERPLSFSILGMLIDRGGVLWIDTTQSLFRLAEFRPGDGQVDDVGAQLGFPERTVGANLLEDASGRIWTHRIVIDPLSNRVHELLPADGADLGEPWFRAYTKTHDGLLLFGGSKGLMVVDPGSFHPEARASPLRVTDISIDAQALPGWNTPAVLSIPSGARTFGVEFAALDFSAPEHVRYEYRLDGYETDWIPQSAERRTASYGNVAPGSYRLQVRAFNRVGTAASNQLSIRVAVEASFWQTRWFTALLVVCALGLVYGGHRLRTASMRERARVLAQQVELRTAELREQVAVREGVELKLKQRNAELEAVNRDLAGTQSQLLQSEKMAAVGQLAAGVAHEINNPIGYVRSNLTNLRSYARDIFSLINAYEPIAQALRADDPKMREIDAIKNRIDFDYLRKDLPNLLSESLDGITRVEKIVRDLREFSHLDEAEWQIVDIHQGLESTLNVAAHEIKYKADIIKEYGQLPQIECLPFQLNQVFLNLLVNAAYAIKGRGKITLRTGCDGDHVWLEVSDTGSGIKPENLTHIFEPFFTTKPIGSGTGLGLSVSYGIVRKHRGSIEVSSVLDQGTTFIVRLPIRAERTDPEPSAVSCGA